MAVPSDLKVKAWSRTGKNLDLPGGGSWQISVIRYTDFEESAST